MATSLRPAVWVVKLSKWAAISTPEDQVHVEIVGDLGLDLVEELPEFDGPMRGIEGGMRETGGARVSLGRTATQNGGDTEGQPEEVQSVEHGLRLRGSDTAVTHVVSGIHSPRPFSRTIRLCRAFYAPVLGRQSLAPGRYFRLLLVGYFEGIDSERGIAWRGARTARYLGCSKKPWRGEFSRSQSEKPGFW